LKSVEAVAEKFGVKLVYEDHSKPGGWDYMDFSNPPDIFLAIAKGIKDTSIGINFDTANILVAGEDRTVEVLEQVIDQVETIHVAETSTKGRTFGYWHCSDQRRLHLPQKAQLGQMALHRRVGQSGSSRHRQSRRIHPPDMGRGVGFSHCLLRRLH